MRFDIEFTTKAEKEMSKMDKQTARKILNYLKMRVSSQSDPRNFGKELKGNLAGLWRYRVENHRIICKIEDERMVVLVVRVGHRKDVYG